MIRAAIGVLSSMLTCLSPTIAFADESSDRSARLVWSLITSGDTTFTTTVVANAFASGGHMSEIDFPLRGIPIRHLKLIFPAHSTPHRSALADTRAEYTICWLGVDRHGEVDCKMIDRTGSSVGMPVDGRRVQLFVAQGLIDGSCAPGFAQQSVRSGARYSTFCSGSLGWLNARTATRLDGFLFDLSTGNLIAQFDSLGDCFAQPRASDQLLLTDLPPNPPGPFRDRYFPVVDGDRGQRTLGPCDSTAWQSQGGGDPEQLALNASRDGILSFDERQDSLALVQVRFDGSGPTVLGVVPYGFYYALSHDGLAFVVMTTEFISYYTVNPNGPVPVWKRPHPKGMPFRLEISEDGHFVAAQLQRKIANSAPHDLYVWDREGHAVLERVADESTRDRLQGIEFIGSDWLLEGAQFANDPLHFNDLLTTRLVNLYQLPE